MDLLRTPDDRFRSLPDYPFEPRYAEVGDGVRVHYVDEGPREGRPVLLFHGEPTWSYLYRKIVPRLASAGYRVIAPDLVGFGRSDKPSSPGDHTYRRHVEWMSELVFEKLDLQGMVLFGQDWGGLIGLRLVAAEPDRFAGVVVGNTGLPTGDLAPNEAFMAWQKFARETEQFPVGRIIAGGCKSTLSDEVIAAYDAPFPDDSYKSAPRVFPSLVPTSTEDPEHEANTRAWAVLEAFSKPWLCAFSDGDPITAGGERAFIRRVPGASREPHTTVTGAGHFLQEDRPDELARIISEFAARVDRP